MNNRQEYLKKYRLEHKEKYREYQRKYRKNHLSTYEKLQQENQKLKKQLEYLRSGEYYNQLRFENEMLQQVVDTNGVPSEVYDYIDCTHRNTELLGENQELKKQLEEKENIACNWKDSCLENAGKIEKLENQQKEFIEYLENEISKWHYNYDSNTYEYELEEPTAEDYANEILQKYKEIIGVSNENNT
jgi:hypothetical protein